MIDSKSKTRRNFFRTSLVSGVGVISLPKIFARTVEECFLTPEQPEGPFYPVSDQADEDWDLTKVKGKTGQPMGQKIHVLGKVIDETCQPVEGALVEIWQAGHNGRYNHPGDRQNPNPLDSNFQYFGHALSKKDGSYIFKTIIPGNYSAGDNWIRPSHIHFKIQKRGFHELITQLYFEGNEFNKEDRILRSLSKEEQSRVVVNFSKNEHVEENILEGVFDITLVKV